MINWAVVWTYLRQYLWVAVLALVTALAYFVSDMVVQVAAQLHPSIRTVVVEKKYEHRDVRVIERTVYRDGVTETVKTSEDRTKLGTETATDTDQKPMLAGGGPGKWTALMGVGRDLGTTYYVGGVNYNVGRLQMQVLVDNPSIHRPAAGDDVIVNPRLTGLVGWTF